MTSAKPSAPVPRKPPVRMKDIAHDLGLSVVTVSKVFRGHHDIGEETRQRVLARIKELNYQPNLAARSLATGRSYFMGLIVPDLVHPFFSELAKHLAGVIRSSGYSLLLSSSEEDTTLELREFEYLLSRRVDVLLVAASISDPASISFQTLRAANHCLDQSRAKKFPARPNIRYFSILITTTPLGAANGKFLLVVMST